MSAIDDLINELARLPGIGSKTATRLTYYLLKQSPESIDRLATAIKIVAGRVESCSVCGNLSDENPCSFCTDARRDSSLVCVVEEALDIDAIERAGEYRGLYHVLGGHLSPLDGIGPEDLRIDQLLSRVRNGSEVREVIIATNPSMEGEVTATYVHDVLKGLGAKVTRIALGLPVGGDLQYSDGVTIARAFSARREMAE